MKKFIIKIILKIYKLFSNQQQDFSTEGFEKLNSFFNLSKINIFDIGSRVTKKNNNNIASRLSLLKQNSTLLICDADNRSIDESEKKLSNDGWRKIISFPYALSNSKEKFIPLYVTKQLGLSSLLKPNESFLKKLPGFIKSKFLIENEINIPNKKLIDVTKENDLDEISHIDIDTQGTELDILKSGEKIIEKNLISITTEVSFQEIYEGQCLFKDIDSYLSKFGFEIFELDRSMILNDPEINYSKKVLFQGDALYFKNPDFIVSNHKNPGLDLMKLITLLVTFHHLNESIRILNNKKYRQLISSNYDISDMKDLENEIRAYSNKFKYHNEIFLKSYELRKYIYNDRDNLHH